MEHNLIELKNSIEALCSRLHIIVQLIEEREQDTIAVHWHIDDVKSIRPDLTDEQARDVLGLVEDSHDCNNGITWFTLEYAAAHLFGDAPDAGDEQKTD